MTRTDLPSLPSTPTEANDVRGSELCSIDGFGNLPDGWDDEQERCVCDRCGGDGFIEYNDGDGGDWGEDCPSEVNHLIVCRQCKGTGEAQ